MASTENFRNNELSSDLLEQHRVVVANESDDLQD